jgi:hypothetical protein
MTFSTGTGSIDSTGTKTQFSTNKKKSKKSVDVIGTRYRLRKNRIKISLCTWF